MVRRLKRGETLSSPMLAEEVFPESNCFFPPGGIILLPLPTPQKLIITLLLTESCTNYECIVGYNFMDFTVHAAVVRSGCYKTPQIGQLQQHILISHSSGG